MHWRILFLFLCFGYGITESFHSFGPNEYYFSVDEYKFASSYEEAEKQCSKTISQLVVIKKMQDFQFIESYIKSAMKEKESKLPQERSQKNILDGELFNFPCKSRKYFCNTPHEFLLNLKVAI